MVHCVVIKYHQKWAYIEGGKLPQTEIMKQNNIFLFFYREKGGKGGGNLIK